ncbi:hypothetical protein BH11ACT5_BH11ACT5_20720 [soil metagenome]
MNSSAKPGWILLGVSVTSLLEAVVVGIFLIARGYEVDESGTGFTTGAEATILIGGLVLAVIAGVAAAWLLRRRS